jgi:N-acetylglucosamine repressor
VVLSPNLRMIDGHSPAADLRNWLRIETVLANEIRGACLAERAYGVARGMSDFVLIWAYGGLGAAAVIDGHILQGYNNLAGELGHVTVDRGGLPCGCGNRGCLETVASDAALSRRLSHRLGQEIDIEQAVSLARDGTIDPTVELDETLDYLAIAVGAAINIFNPEAVLVCAVSLDVLPDALERLNQRVAQRTLSPLLRQCQVLRATGDTRRGAVASIVQHLTHALGPGMAQ